MFICHRFPQLQNEKEMSLQDRVAFACTYLDDVQVCFHYMTLPLSSVPFSPLPSFLPPLFPLPFLSSSPHMQEVGRKFGRGRFMYSTVNVYIELMQSCKLLYYTNVCRVNTELSKLPFLAATQLYLSADQVSHLQGAY